MSSEADPPATHAIADSWADFSELILPGVGGDEDADAHVAFYFGALSVLQIVKQVVEERSAEAAARALEMLGAELDEFMKAHGIQEH